MALFAPPHSPNVDVAFCRCRALQASPPGIQLWPKALPC